MPDLSVVIPAREEEFLNLTIRDILRNRRGDTEIIVILDGYTPKEPLPERRRLKVIKHDQFTGQRASTNEGVIASNSKYVMKADAHCAFDEGFDVKLMADCEKDWTVVPLMYNLHIFNWKCFRCDNLMYQGPKPEKCSKCGSSDLLRQRKVWLPRRGTQTSSMMFDKELVFQYWKKRRTPGDIVETMSFIGACWFMQRDRYLELEGLDEKHGFWGQVGTEVSCKTWLSGGKLVVNKKTWFAHFFRTQFGWPYKIHQGDVDRARNYSRDMWFNNRWNKQIYPLKWLVDRFSPVPTWEGFQWKLDV
jgi:glycosyltransferase involved in cell wall biosynthesis